MCCNISELNNQNNQKFLQYISKDLDLTPNSKIRIKDILNDKIVVATAYPDEEKFEKQIRYSVMQSFVLESKDDESDFENFVNRVSKPRSFLNRLNVFAFHGVIEISDWSGSKYHKFYRK